MSKNVWYRKEVKSKRCLSGVNLISLLAQYSSIKSPLEMAVISHTTFVNEFVSFLTIFPGIVIENYALKG